MGTRVHNVSLHTEDETMNRKLPLLFCSVLALIALLWPSAGRANLAPIPGDLTGLSVASQALARSALAATVYLRVDHKPDGDSELSGAGTGFVVDAIRGIVVTNHHVVGEKGARVRAVLHDGRTSFGDVLGSDPQTDLAVVRLPEGFARRQLPWGDSDALAHGSWVLAVGHPLGLKQTATLGVVSGLHRVIGLNQEGSIEDFIQHDAFIDMGSSGGPLVNMDGDVVGINTAIASNPSGYSGWQGVSWAVPAELARRVIADLIAHGEARHPSLGVAVRDLQPGDAKSLRLDAIRGALVTKIQKDSPADHAGIQKGDVILSAGGVELVGRDHLRARVGMTPADATLQIHLWRNGKPINLAVTLSYDGG